MNKIAQLMLGIIGTILIPLAITSLSLATNYGSMGESLTQMKEQNTVIMSQNEKIMNEITDIKLTSATHAQQLIGLEGTQALLVKKTDQSLVNYGRIESEVRSLRETSEQGDARANELYTTLKVSQDAIVKKIDESHNRSSKIEADLARVETLITIDSKDRFSGKEGAALSKRIDNLEKKVDNIR